MFIEIEQPETQEKPENMKGGKEVKKVFRIVLALAVVLGLSLAAMPVGAELAPPTVVVSDDIAGAVADYTITFHNPQILTGDDGDYIDVHFPVGTDITGIGVVTVTVLPALVISVTPQVDNNNIRLVLDAGEIIEKCDYVVIVVPGVTNPAPCYHVLQLGTSNQPMVESAPYKIYLIKLTLSKGWNLISLPGIPEDSAITVVLADLILKAATDLIPFTFKVYSYDSGTWYAFNNGSYASLTTMTECRAYWIWVSAAVTFKVKGIWYPLPPGPPLKKCYSECWNMVGFTSNVDRDPFVTVGLVGGYMETLTPPGSVFYIMGWDATNQVWDPILTPDMLIVGQGYWMSFIADACFAPPPPGA